MRIRTLSSCFLQLVFLAFPATAFSTQDVSPGPKKEEKQINAESASGLSKPVENWKALDDIQTGLDPHPTALVSTDEQPEFVRELVRVQWRVGDPVDLWIIRPRASEKVPVVLYLYSYPSDPDQFRDDRWCKRATTGGFAAVGFVSAMTGPRYRMRPMKEWFVSQLPESLGSTVHDIQLILNYLASRADLDSEHVGMFGIGSGATIAILAAHTDARIKTLDLLDPWGAWPDWLRESPAVPDEERAMDTTEEFLKSVAPFDPVAYLPSLKTGSVRLQQTLTDPVTPKSARDRIAASLRDPSDLVRYANPEEHLKAWQTSGLSGWLKQQLNAQRQGENRNNHHAAANPSSR